MPLSGFRFSRSSLGSRIETPGIDFSGRLTAYSEEGGGFEIWRKSPGSVWAGIGSPREYVPAALLVVRTYKGERFGDDRADILLDVNYGRRFKAVLTECRAFIEGLREPSE